MAAPPPAPALDHLPAPSVEGAAAMLLFERRDGFLTGLDWRSSLLSLLSHLLFASLLFLLAYWMGKPPPPELPAIEVSLAQDPEPPPPPPPPREQPRPVPPLPPPILPRASDASSLGEGAPQAAAKNDTPSAQPAERAAAPRVDQPAPQAKPAEKPEEPASVPDRPRPRPEPVPSETAEAAPAPNDTPPVLATEQAPKEARPVAPPRASPPPSLALRTVPRPAAPPAAEIQPQRRSSESTAPPPSPRGLFDRPDGPLGAIYDAYLDDIRNRVMAQRHLLAPYFKTSEVPVLRIHLMLDPAGRYLGTPGTNTHYLNLTTALLKMIALSAPFPPPPRDLMISGRVGIILEIDLPTTQEAWRQAFP